LSDNVPITPGVGADIATDDVGGVQYQRFKLDIGADGVASGTAGTAANPIRVDPTGTTPQPVSGTVAVTGVATAANQATLITALTAVNAAIDGIEALLTEIAAETPLTDTQLRATPVPVDTELPTAAALADGVANPTTTTVGAALLAFNGTTYHRVYVAVAPGNTDGVSGSASNGFDVRSGTYAYNGATWDRVRGDTANGLDVDVTRLPALPAGTNNIGDVDVLTLPAIPAGNNNIGDVDIASIAAGDNNIGNVDVVTLPALPAGTNNIGDVDVLTNVLPAGGTITATTTSITTTASIQVHANTACKGVRLQNDPDNVNDMLVGTSGSEVFQLTPGQSIYLPVSNVNQCYAKNVTSSTQTLAWISVT
jgi:hypothetical protein